MELHLNKWEIEKGDPRKITQGKIDGLILAAETLEGDPLDKDK